jgi:hypothetical protein
LRFVLQHALEEVAPAAFDAPLVELGGQFGHLEHHFGAGLHRRAGLVEGLGGVGEAAGHHVAAAEHGPAFEIARVFFELGGEGVDHFFDLGGGGLLAFAGRRVEGGRRAEHDVQHGGGQRQRDGQRQRGARQPARGQRRGVGHLGGGDVFEHPAFELVAGAAVVGLGQHAAGQVTLELGELVAVDGGVDGLARGARATVPAQQRPAQHGEDEEGEQAGADPEGGHALCLGGLSVPGSARRASAAALSAAVRAVGARPALRRRR